MKFQSLNMIIKLVHILLLNVIINSIHHPTSAFPFARPMQRIMNNKQVSSNMLSSFFSRYSNNSYHTFSKGRNYRISSTKCCHPFSTPVQCRWNSHLLCSQSNNNNSAMNTIKNSNEYLVQARIQARNEKRQIREKSLEDDKERNLKIKRMIHNDSQSNKNNGLKAGGFQVPNLYALRVSVDKQLREELKMNGREKRGRVFIEEGTEGCKSLKGLKSEVHSFFRCLKKSTYLLSAGMPQILDDGSIHSPGSEDVDNNDDREMNQPYKAFIPIENDDDVNQIFIKAQECFNAHNSDLSKDATNRLKRPSLLLYVRKDPNAPKPPPPPSYLQNMNDPKSTETMTMLSFYSFPESGIEDAEEFGLFLKKIWKPFDALGRIYVAKEGVNAQMSIPTNVLTNFKECCMQVPELGKYMENGINIDPIPLTMEQFAVAGDMDGKPVPPFKNLYIRVRQQIVADGLDRSLDWEKAGYDMPPMEWHDKLKEAKEKRETQENDSIASEDVPLIFDCRNDYETSVGGFEGAIPLNTTNFRDSWDVLGEQLKDSPKDTPIMTYCTGGIRCVKVGAYLTQELGFTNVSRLAGGIIAYDRTLNENSPEAEPMFKGTNYVFDGRLGRQITDDALGECITCGAKTHLVTNCSNGNCHKRMVQCETCKTDFIGTCSDACKHRVTNDANAPSRVREFNRAAKYNNVNEYSLGYSSTVPSFYEEIKKNTEKYIGSGLHMISDTAQGMLLKNFAAMSREGRILEIGSFTGYATSCFLEGAANAAEVTQHRGEVGNREGGAFVLSLERDPRAFDLASFHIRTMCNHGVEDMASQVASLVRDEYDTPPQVEENPVSLIYNNASCEIRRVNDALAFVETMASGIENTSIKPFDIVFIDADKTRFLQYVEACLHTDIVLKKGGIMIVDNVLWKGLVLNCGVESDSPEGGDSNKAELKKSRRARKLAGTVHAFNEAIIQDDRVEVLMLPIRDGLSIIRKK